MLADAGTSALAGKLLAFIAVQCAMIFGFAGLGSFAGKYLNIRGRILALAQDFKLLTNQLEHDAGLAETIESGRADGREREGRRLRASEFQALCEAINQCSRYVDQHRSIAADGKLPRIESPLPRIETLQRLYFPELAVQTNDVINAVLNLVRAGEHPKSHPVLEEALAAFRLRARSVLEEIAG
ncbi:MAG TPA: hypothetical protein VMW18_03645 [Candidatus Binatia bacterium]|nr:hypothetical protein [Candidatus Binatia bacterium]